MLCQQSAANSRRQLSCMIYFENRVDIVDNWPSKQQAHLLSSAITGMQSENKQLDSVG